jgi:hypothetical protein
VGSQTLAMAFQLKLNSDACSGATVLARRFLPERAMSVAVRRRRLSERQWRFYQIGRVELRREQAPDISTDTENGQFPVFFPVIRELRSDKKNVPLSAGRPSKCGPVLKQNFRGAARLTYDQKKKGCPSLQ